MKKKIVRVIGPPRSGTNLVKYLIEINTNVDCVFDYGYWKHAIPPAHSYHQKLASTITIPTFVMLRNPRDQLTAFYKSAFFGYKVLQANLDPEFFISSPIILSNPDVNLTYRFSSPVAYLNSYYRSAVKLLSSNTALVLLEDVVLNENLVIHKLSDFVPKLIQFARPHVPEQYLARSSNQRITLDTAFQPYTCLKSELSISSEIQNWINFDSKEYDLYVRFYNSLIPKKYL